MRKIKKYLILAAGALWAFACQTNEMGKEKPEEPDVVDIDTVDIDTAGIDIADIDETDLDTTGLDMANIDFSNIEDLYAQPLPVIQKCIEGKWKWYISIGGVVGVSYSENTFVDIYTDHYMVEYDDGNQRTFYFTGKRYYSNLLGFKTYVMWNNELDQGIWYFETIKNDTLSVGNVPPLGATFWQFGSGFARVKQ